MWLVTACHLVKDSQEGGTQNPLMFMTSHCRDGSNGGDGMLTGLGNRRGLSNTPLEGEGGTMRAPLQGSQKKGSEADLDCFVF
jgi:hypothetical protein